MTRTTLVTFTLVAIAACGTDWATRADAAFQPGSSTLAAIRAEIFDKRCVTCHTSASAGAAHLDLRSNDVCHALVLHSSCLFPNRMLVVPGKPEDSFLLDKLKGIGLDVAPDEDCSDTNQRMPVDGPWLQPDKLDQIEQWIREGASCGVSVPPDAGVDAQMGPPEDLTSISSLSPKLRAGEKTQVTVTLARGAPVGGQNIDLLVDRTVLDVPTRVHVDESQQTVTFDVLTIRPVRWASLTASSGTSSQSLKIKVTGLALSEVLYNPIFTDTNEEWIKISNETDVAIDLARYTLGSGRTSYTYTVMALVGWIAPHSCFVVGGPNSSTSNGNPSYSEMADFRPDLLNGSGTNGQATGFALFDVPYNQLGDAAVPLDSLLCGTNNLSGLLGADGLPATPNYHDVSAGHSVVRANAVTWTEQDPKPNLCTTISL